MGLPGDGPSPRRLFFKKNNLVDFGLATPDIADMDQTTPFRSRPAAAARRLPRTVPVLAFWAVALMLVGARVALFDGIRPAPDTTGSISLAR